MRELVITHVTHPSGPVETFNHGLSVAGMCFNFFLAQCHCDAVSHHVQLFSHFLKQLQETSDGDGTLLDSSLVLYGAGLGDSNDHLHYDLPVTVVGGRGTGWRGGRHLKYPKDTPMANLLVSMLDKAGLPAEKFGDSTGRLTALTDI